MADTSGVDPNAPQPAGATPEQAAAAIASVTAKPADAPAGSQSPTVDWGTVVSYGFPSASQQYPSLSIKVGGGTNSGVKYYGFTPRIGDWIMLLRSGRDIWVPGSRPPIGTLKFSDVALNDPIYLLCNGAAVPAGYPNLSRVPNFTDRLPMMAGSTVGLGGTAGASISSGVGSHTHTHTHDHGPHSHGPSGGGSFITNRGSGGGVSSTAPGSVWPGDNTSSVLAGSGGSNAISTAGGSFSIIPPVYGVYIYVCAC